MSDVGLTGIQSQKPTEGKYRQQSMIGLRKRPSRDLCQAGLEWIYVALC